MLIYCIENKINGKRYVGMTTQSLEDRIAQHVSESRYSRKKLIHKAIAKYGIDSFVISVLDEAHDLEQLKELERYYITTLSTLAPNGYNLTYGGDGVFGYKHSDNARALISDSSRALWVRLYNDADKLNARNRAISDNLKGRVFSEEHRKKLSNSAKERIGDKNPFYGKIHSSDTKDKISQANKGKIHKSRRKPVRMRGESIDITFGSCMEAYQYLFDNGYTTNKSYRSVTSMIKEAIVKEYVLYGMRWYYIEKV